MYKDISLMDTLSKNFSECCAFPDYGQNHDLSGRIPALLLSENDTLLIHDEKIIISK